MQSWMEADSPPPVAVLLIFGLSRPVEVCREDRPPLKGSTDVSRRILEAHVATSRNVLEMEHTMVVRFVGVLYFEVFVRLIQVTNTYDVQVMLSYGVLTPHCSC